MANGFYKRAENNISKDNLKELYENCLILLYRLLFVLYAEGRDLLPVKYGGSGSNMHYRERYSLQRLIPKLKNSLNFSSDEITELYEDILKLFHLINGDNPALNRKCDVPLYNGGLFDSKKYPLLERWILGEKTLANILKGFIFSNIPVEKGEQDRLSFSETIDYADLEIRHLGSIYEGLLENHLEHENNNIILKGDRAERKTTGTYYTPDYIVRYIIDNTLGPVCNEIEKSEEIRNSVAKKSRDDSFAKAALNLKILDPAMGSGHFLVRATEFLADKIFYHTTTKLKVERVLQGLSQEQAEIAYWRRKVVESCIFGVDLNPLAVELSKLSLWLTSIATDQPLSFLDHHLRPGNSLIGANLNALGWLHTRKERIQRSLFADLQKEVGQAIQTLHAIEVIETNDLTIIKEKETLWNKEVRDRLLPLRTIADLWTSSFFGTKINDTKYQNLARLIMSNPKPRTKEAMMLKREIGPYLNFYEVAKKMMFFHWELEFPDVFFNEDGSPKENPGFDAIIGNPPYINIENIPKVLREYFVIFYGENHKLGKRYDIYQLFVLKGLSLLKNFSYMGFILPNTFLMGHSYKIMMKIVTNMTKILECVDLPHGVFKEVTVDNVLLFLMRNPNDQERIKNMIVIKKLDPKSEISRILSNSWDEVFSIPQQILSKEYDYKLNIHSNPTQQKLFHLLESVSIQLGKITESSQGIILYKTAEDSARAEYTSKTPKEGWKRLLRGKNIGRYFIKYNGEFVHYGPWLWCPREEKYLNRAKILLQAMRNKSLFRRLVATYDNERYYNAHNLANIIKKEDSPYHLKYILGLVNSLLLNYWYKAHFPNVNINPNDFRQLPIRKINFNNSSEKKLHDDLVVLVDVMLDLNKKIQSAKGSAKDQIQRQIEKTDREIDEIVYKLYGITEEEKMIIEGIS
jgi:type I restriction-modification system DNA methylase subunit